MTLGTIAILVRIPYPAQYPHSTSMFVVAQTLASQIETILSARFRCIWRATHSTVTGWRNGARRAFLETLFERKKTWEGWVSLEVPIGLEEGPTHPYFSIPEGRKHLAM